MADRKTEPDCVPLNVDGAKLPPEIKGEAIYGIWCPGCSCLHLVILDGSGKPMARMALAPTDAFLFCGDLLTGQTVLTVHDQELGKRLAEKNAAFHAGDAIGPVAGHG